MKAVMEKGGRKQDFFISLDRIENPAVVALDICADIGNPLAIVKR